MGKTKYRKPWFPEGTLEEIEVLVKTVKKPNQLKKVQAILFTIKFDKKSEEIAELLDQSVSWVKTVWSRYREQGKEYFFTEKRGSGRGKRFLLFSEEEEFLKPFLEDAKKGGILTVSVVHKALEEKLGKKVYLSMIYKLLHRHNWRKIVPRKYHPKADKKKQIEFKQNFSSNLEGIKKNS